jgi:hypothetical protein
VTLVHEAHAASAGRKTIAVPTTVAPGSVWTRPD